MPDTQVERISQLDIGDGKLYEFAGANSGVVFNDVTEALAAIQAGTVQNGDVFYIKNDGTSGYPVFIGTSAQITTADNAGKIPAGMLIFCTDDSVNDITALQVSYGNTTVKAKLDELGDTDISDIGDGTVTGAVSQLDSDLAMVENGINTASPSSELRISANRYQLEFTVDTSTLSANTWNTIGSLPADAVKYTATFNFEKSIVIVNEGGYSFAHPICEEATTVQFRFDMISGVVQIYCTSVPSGFRICLEYSK